MTQAAGSDGRGTHHDDFRLSIIEALGDQLLSTPDPLGRATLAEDPAALDERPGAWWTSESNRCHPLSPRFKPEREAQ